MKIPNPDVYFGKTLRVYDVDGGITEGKFAGFNYDYDDEDNLFLEFDVDDSATGLGISFTEGEIERIEVLA